MLKKKVSVRCLPFVKRMFLFLLLAAAAALLTGCITFLTEINVKGDGSGTMVQTITLNPEQMKEAMEGIARQMGATTEAKKDSEKSPSKTPEEGPFRESDLKGKAEDLGPGVTFVSAEKIDTKTAAGVRVTYAFKDINQLSVNPKPAAAMGTAGAGASSEDALKFRLKRKPDGNAVLTIIFAGSKPEAAKEQTATPQPSPGEPDEQIAMMKQIFKGLHMGLTVDVDGKVVRTNSPYVEGSKVTLLDIDFDPLLSDEKGFKALSAKLKKAKGDDIKTMEALKGIKGLKVPTGPEVSIEFSPEKQVPQPK